MSRLHILKDENFFRASECRSKRPREESNNHSQDQWFRRVKHPHFARRTWSAISKTHLPWKAVKSRNCSASSHYTMLVLRLCRTCSSFGPGGPKGGKTSSASFENIRRAVLAADASTPDETRMRKSKWNTWGPARTESPSPQANILSPSAAPHPFVVYPPDLIPTSEKDSAMRQVSRISKQRNSRARPHLRPCLTARSRPPELLTRER